MRVLAFAAALLLTATAVPASADLVPESLVPADEAPQLEASVIGEGIRLEWTYPGEEAPGQTIEATEIWRYESYVSAGTLGVEVVGEWELHDVRQGSAMSYVDASPDAGGETFYAVQIINKDGSRTPLSNPSSGEYPHCGWLYVGVPPMLHTKCLFPPPDPTTPAPSLPGVEF